MFARAPKPLSFSNQSCNRVEMERLFVVGHVNSKDEDWYRSVQRVLHEDGPPGAIIELLGGDLDVPSSSQTKATVLADAIPRYTGTKCQVALELLRAGADPVDAGDGSTIIMRALSAGIPALVEAVVTAGGLKGVRLTPPRRLMLAACRNDVEEVRRLLSSPNVKPTSFRGNANGPGYEFITPLVAAARGGFLEVARALVDAGCPPTWGVGRWSIAGAPAYQAALFGHGALARFLGGVDPVALAAAAHKGGHLELARSFDPKIDARVAAAARAAAQRNAPVDAEKLLRAWRAELAEHRRPWPEWRELEQRASEEWEVVESKGVAHTSIELSIERRDTTTAAGVPKWLSALAGLRPSRHMLRHALFGELGFGRVTRQSKSFFPELEHADHMPSGCTALMMTLCGGIVVLRGADVWRVEGRALIKVGDLDTFTRYVLRCALDGRDWLYGGLNEAYLLDQYALDGVGG